eukprot:PRCOL_00005156-RA
MPPPLNLVLRVLGAAGAVRRFASHRTELALRKFWRNPRGALIIPLVAAAVGWVTNWLAVQMIFYPLSFMGVPIKQFISGSMYGCAVLEPLGLVGWQGIVPAKAAQMSFDMVSMVTAKLIDVREVFGRLDPDEVARLLRPEVPLLAEEVARGLRGVPEFAVDIAAGGLPALPAYVLDALRAAQDAYVAGFTTALQKVVDTTLDLKELVVCAMCEDKRVLVELFQRCGDVELKFLVDSGLWFGFLLGVIQMIVWMFYDNPWTLTIGGLIVGFATNWLALKCIFEPVEPVQVGPFEIQGMFLKRQHEVSIAFSDYLAENVLTSRKMWETMLEGQSKDEFRKVLGQHTKEFLNSGANRFGIGNAAEAAAVGAGAVASGPVVEEVVDSMVERLKPHLEPLHAYVDDTLDLKEVMREKMLLMTPQEFERVLHPIFEQDELTLILAGAALGAIAGFGQQITTAPEPPLEDAEGEGKARAPGAQEEAGGADDAGKAVPAA